MHPETNPEVILKKKMFSILKKTVHVLISLYQCFFLYGKTDFFNMTSGLLICRRLKEICLSCMQSCDSSMSCLLHACDVSHVGVFCLSKPCSIQYFCWNKVTKIRSPGAGFGILNQKTMDSLQGAETKT